MNIPTQSAQKAFSRGFTLIELLVVISIIGILSSVVLASVAQARAGARDAARTQAVREVRNALELYYLANKSYPISSPSLNTIEKLVAPTGPLASYLKSLPANFTIAGATSTYVSSGSYYSVAIRTERGGQFNKNTGCNTTDFSNYDTSTSKSYCSGNNPPAPLGMTSGGGSAVVSELKQQKTGPTTYLLTWTTADTAIGSSYCMLSSEWVLFSEYFSGINPVSLNGSRTIDFNDIDPGGQQEGDVTITCHVNGVQNWTGYQYLSP
ncbi:MAG: hypothetical protein RIT04_591 [Candidatus Parcubacteria bacterium]|jgi:prepilin-type N-terminal cleavage/methylation domain-containing protein